MDQTWEFRASSKPTNQPKMPRNKFKQKSNKSYNENYKTLTKKLEDPMCTYKGKSMYARGL